MRPLGLDSQSLCKIQRTRRNWRGCRTSDRLWVGLRTPIRSRRIGIWRRSRIRWKNWRRRSEWTWGPLTRETTTTRTLILRARVTWTPPDIVRAANMISSMPTLLIARTRRKPESLSSEPLQRTLGWELIFIDEWLRLFLIVPWSTTPLSLIRHHQSKVRTLRWWRKSLSPKK